MPIRHMFERDYIMYPIYDSHSNSTIDIIKRRRIPICSFDEGKSVHVDNE
jgi:hypothetical protein